MNKNFLIYTKKKFLFRFISNALRNDNDKKDPRISLLTNKLSNSIPPCLLIAAELDPLRDDSYSKRKMIE
jgi:acetyl esterase/lipase